MQDGRNFMACRGGHFRGDLTQCLARHIFIACTDCSVQQQKRGQIRWWGRHAAGSVP